MKITARLDCIDKYDRKHKVGDSWLVRESGLYLQGAGEEIDEKPVHGRIITNDLSLHLKAKCNFIDVYKINRTSGEEWLITFKQASIHFIDANEILINEVPITKLNQNQFCNILNPMSDSKTLYGHRTQRKGELSFFLQPREVIIGGIQSVENLTKNDALILMAQQDFTMNNKEYKSGQTFLIRGPCDFILPIEATISERRKAIDWITNNNNQE